MSSAAERVCFKNAGDEAAEGYGLDERAEEEIDRCTPNDFHYLMLCTPKKYRVNCKRLSTTENFVEKYIIYIFRFDPDIF